MKNNGFGKPTRFVLVLMVAFCYFTFVVYFEAKSRSPFSSSTYTSESLPSETAIEYTHLRLLIELEPPGDLATPTARMKLIGLQYWTTNQEEFGLDELCFEALFLSEGYSHRRMLFVEDMLGGVDEPICLRMAVEDQLIIGDMPTVIYASYEPDGKIRTTYSFRNPSQSFWYPYDSLKTYLSLQAQYYTVSGTDELPSQLTSPLFTIRELPPNMEWYLSLLVREYEQNQIAGVTSTNPMETSYWVSVDRHVNVKELEITFSRPITYRVVVPVIFLGFVVLLAILATVDSVGTFLQVSIAGLVGMLGLRQVLILPNIERTTIIDALSLGLYMIFALILILFSTRMLLNKDFEREKNAFVPNPSNLPQESPPDEAHRSILTQSSSNLGFLVVILSLGAALGWVLSELKRRY